MKYISMLRGINVGGRRKVGMADLKAMYENLGFRNVLTYIQSGNVLFDSDIGDEYDLRTLLEKEIESKFDFGAPVIIRTENEIRNLIGNYPFGRTDLKKDRTIVAVTFLSSNLNKNMFRDLKNHLKPGEKIAPGFKEIYLLCPEGYGKIKLTNEFIEKKLNVDATTRNWRTVNKILSLFS